MSCYIKAILHTKDQESKDWLIDYIVDTFEFDKYYDKFTDTGNEVIFTCDWVDTKGLNTDLSIMSKYITDAIIYVTDFDSFGEIKLFYKNEQWTVAPELPIYGKAVPFNFDLGTSQFDDYIKNEIDTQFPDISNDIEDLMKQNILDKIGSICHDFLYLNKDSEDCMQEIIKILENKKE